jgi:phosphate transport system substrate-binding protein
VTIFAILVPFICRRLALVLMIVAVACWVALCAPARSQDVLGAGSTFVYPVLLKWADAYRTATGVEVIYQGIGSGAGIWQIRRGTVDFGASDAPLRAEELSAAGLMQFPLVVGGVVPVVNLDGIRPGQLRLTGYVLADIYRGKITRWNADAISSLNPGLALPDQAIVPIHRADGSGTTFVFADFLARVSAPWRDEIGVGPVVDFPSGFGGRGNDGVALFTSRTKGAIGYVEYSYALKSRLAYASVKNRAGEFVIPSRQSFRSAVANADWDGALSFQASLADRPGAQTWPITGATFVLIHKQQQKYLTANAMLKFFDWSYRTGAGLADELNYVPLPGSVVQRVEAAWPDVKDLQGQPAWTGAATAQH